jgi:tellurite resistance protein TerC
VHTNPWFWIIFNACVLAVLAIDLLAFQRKAHAPSAKEAAIWTAVWLALSLGFNGLILHWMGPGKALEFLTGYLVEYSLSVDNVLVFILIFSNFAVPIAYQHRVLFWGVLSALILRGIMVAIGAAIVAEFHWAFYVFGAFLIMMGAKMLFSGKEKVDSNPLLKLARQILPVTDRYHGERFSVHHQGRWMLTPLAMTLIMVEATDAIFAIDSIPAIFGITRDPFIVYTSSVCAALGLRSLYFLLAGAIHKLAFMKYGLAVVLAFIGVKMLLSEFYPIPTAISLTVIGSVLLITIGFSLLAKRQATNTGGRKSTSVSSRATHAL